MNAERNTLEYARKLADRKCAALVDEFVAVESTAYAELAKDLRYLQGLVDKIGKCLVLLQDADPTGLR